MSKIDLHIHSRISGDGEFSPKEIIARCRAEGMEMVAIADHNSVRGVPEALAAAGSLRVLTGVELDCVWEGRNFRLLGYGFDPEWGEFARVEEDILRQEKAAATEKIRLFREATGIGVSEEEVLAAAEDGVVTGELIAEFVLSGEEAEKNVMLRPYLPGGDKSDMPNVRFYWDFFSEGKPAYVPIRYLSLTNAAALVHRAGGIAVLAHPGQNLGGERALLSELIGRGIDGIEAFSSYHSAEDAAFYLEAAVRNGLLVTCGSDFHGRHKPGIKLGGHGATLDDGELMARVERRLLGRA